MSLCMRQSVSIQTYKKHDEYRVINSEGKLFTVHCIWAWNRKQFAEKISSVENKIKMYFSECQVSEKKIRKAVIIKG